MDISNLDILSDSKKTHYLLALLPLITFVFYKLNIWIIAVYTVVLALISVYIHILIAFKENSMRSVIYQKEKNLKDFWYIPHIWLFAILTIVCLFAFGYSFVLTFLNLYKNNIYNNLLFLAHIFLVTFDIFMLIVLRHYRLLIPKLKKQGIIKNAN